MQVESLGVLICLMTFLLRDTLYYHEYSDRYVDIYSMQNEIIPC